MAERLFKLEADYDTSKSVVFSADENILRVFGRDHNNAATIKPDLTLIDPAGETIATMDAWADDWTEGGP